MFVPRMTASWQPAEKCWTKIGKPGDPRPPSQDFWTQLAAAYATRLSRQGGNFMAARSVIVQLDNLRGVGMDERITDCLQEPAGGELSLPGFVILFPTLVPKQ